MRTPSLLKVLFAYGIIPAPWTNNNYTIGVSTEVYTGMKYTSYYEQLYYEHLKLRRRAVTLFDCYDGGNNVMMYRFK